MTSFLKAASAAALALGLLLPTSAVANEREAPSRLPFYMRTIEATDSPLSVVVFYRPIDCIPADFNLIAMFDAPRAFGCGPQTVESFAVWETGVGQDPFGPIQSRARGLGAVPIWLVDDQALDLAQSDGVMTLAELESLDPLVGVADFYTETLHPLGAVRNVLLVVDARGTLEDGRTLTVHVTRRPADRLMQVTISS